MAWIYLIAAGLFEIVWAFAMKQSHGFTKFWPGLLTLTMMIVSFWLLSLAMRTLPLGTAYAIWTGIGAIGAFIVGIMFLGEAASTVRILAILMIAGGIALMKASG